MRSPQMGQAVRLPELAALNFDVTLFGGQAFRWRRDAGGAIGWIGDRPVRAEPGPAGLEVAALDGRDDGLEDAARRYFDVGRDYAAIERRLLRRDGRLRRAAAGVLGFRILRQPAFETLVAFIASANNNIVRLSRSLDALARIAGRPVDTPAGTLWAFPEPAAIASRTAEELRAEANLGYRDRYVVEASRLVASGELDLDALDRLPTAELRTALLGVPGVGHKVADCIALYGFGRVEVFPVDTWVRKAFLALYLEDDERPNNRAIAELAAARFGGVAGVAQQYMFEAFRRGLATGETADRRR